MLKYPFGKSFTLGILLLALGLFLALVVSLTLLFGSNSLLRQAVNGRKILTPLHPYGLAGNESTASMTPYFRRVFLFNLTNAQQVLQSGATPSYSEIGPYVYRKLVSRLDSTFSSDLDNLYFLQCERFVFDPDSSGKGLSPDTDVIVNLNPSYVGVLKQLGSESELLRHMVGGALQLITNDLTTVFPWRVLASFRSFLLYLRSILCIAYTRSPSKFFEIWSQEFHPPDLVFDGMLLSENHTTTANISYDSASLMWDLVKENSFVNALEVLISGYSRWDDAADRDNATILMLESKFNLTRPQVLRVADWLRSFTKHYVWPYLHQLFGIDSQDVEDLGWLQWGEGKGTPFHQSVKTYNDSIPGYPEYFFFVKNELLRDNLPLNVSMSRWLVNGSQSRDPFPDHANERPLSQPQWASEFIRYHVKGDYDKIRELWLLDQDRSHALGEYLLYLNRTFVVPLLQNLISDGNGPIAVRRVSEWTFNFSDPFLAMLRQPFYQHASMFVNVTSDQWCREHTGNSWIKSGKRHISQIGDAVVWNGTSVVSGVWAQQIPVWGPIGPQFDATLISDLEDELDESDPALRELPLWFPALLRTVTLIPDNISSSEGSGARNNTFVLKGITVKRYRLNPQVFTKDPVFYQNLAGFANLSSVNSIPIYSAPIFLSKPHFWECDNVWWHDRLINMSRPSAEHDESWLEIEPLTGIVMNERMGQQANIYIPPLNESIRFDVFGTRIPADTMYPLVWIQETSAIPDERAAQFRWQLYLPMTITTAASVLSLVVGCTLMLMGAVLIAVDRWRNRPEKRELYSAIGSSSDE